MLHAITSTVAPLPPQFVPTMLVLDGAFSSLIAITYRRGQPPAHSITYLRIGPGLHPAALYSCEIIGPRVECARCWRADSPQDSGAPRRSDQVTAQESELAALQGGGDGLVP